MDNNQNNNNVNNEPVLQPLNETPQAQPTVQPTVQQAEAANTGNNSEEDMALHTRIIQDEKANPQINLAAYEKAKEKKEKVQKEFVEDPHAGAKRIFGLILVLAIVVFAVFLPTISDKINEMKNKKELENLTTGQLRCSMSQNTDTLRIEYNQNFRFRDSKIYTYKYEEVSTGTREDSEELGTIDKNCRTLDQSTSGITGITITCSITSTNASVVQEFDLEHMEVDKMKSAFSEAGGQFPEFSAGDSVDTVEAKVQRAGYTCEKVS